MKSAYYMYYFYGNSKKTTVYWASVITLSWCSGYVLSDLTYT